MCDAPKALVFFSRKEVRVQLVRTRSVVDSRPQAGYRSGVSLLSFSPLVRIIKRGIISSR